MLERYGGYSARWLMVLALLVLLAGCAGESSQPMLDLVGLQMQLVAEYGGSNVVAALQDARTLSVTIADETFTGPAGNRGPERAREVAEFVCKHYGPMDNIETIQVEFLIRRDGSVVDASGRLAYTFARTELACNER